MKKEQIEIKPKILGLDVSSKTIGMALFEMESKCLLQLTHISPKPKLKTENKMEELIAKAEIVSDKLKEYSGLGITDVVIEAPLLNSNNVFTVATLLRFNTLVSKGVYDVLGIIPEFISTYDSRKFAFPFLVEKNPKGKYVLFGGFPKDCDKKMIIWEQVSKREPQILWNYTKHNTLKKEVFDQSDAYCCVMGYMKQKGLW